MGFGFKLVGYIFLIALIGYHNVEARYFGAIEPETDLELVDNVDLEPVEEDRIGPVGDDIPTLESNELNSKLLYLTSKHAKENQQWSAISGHHFDKILGDVSGLAASQDFLYIFHRANVTWNEKSFNEETNVYNHQHNPIDTDTVYAVDLETAEVMFSWGKNSFYMPHGISVDPQDNVWLTDVALHQAFRFKKNNFEQADLILGEQFVPGSDENHFCKPTDVAVASSGFVYISDGYCNSRVVIFSASGKYLTEFGQNEKMQIPHSVSLLEIEDLICVADRENGRILCYSAGLNSDRPAGQLLFEVEHNELHKIYGIASLGDMILALNGGTESSTGISIDLATEQVVDVWTPINRTFQNAHDLTVGHSGQSFYVCQLVPNGQKIIKFDLLDYSPPPPPQQPSLNNNY